MYLPPAPALGGLLTCGMTGVLPGPDPPTATPTAYPAGAGVSSLSTPKWAEEESTSGTPGLGCGLDGAGAEAGGPGATAPGPSDSTPAGVGSVTLGSRLTYYNKLVNYTS